MDRVNRKNCEVVIENGQAKRVAFGPTGLVNETEANMGWIRYAKVYGDMKPEKGACRSLLVEDAKDAVLYYGAAADALDQCEKVDVHDHYLIGPEDWFKFAFDADDGFVDVLYFTNDGDNKMEIG